MNGGNGFDGAAAVVSVGLGLTVGEQQGGGDVGVDMTNVQVKSKFRQFLKSKEDSDGAFSYREQLLTNYEQGSFHLSVDMDDIRGFDQALLTVLRDDPSKYMPVFEQAAKEVVGELNLKQGENADALKDIQILLSNFPRLISLRELSAEHVSNLVTVRGIVVSAGKVSVKATSLTIICGNCNATKQIPCHSGFGGARMPRRCDTPYTPNSGLTKCPLDPYRILADASEYVDMQLLKVQEFPEDVPTGEMPRHLKASAERYLVGTVKPGSRVTLVGIYSTYESRDKRSAAATSRKDGVRDIGIRIPYLRVLGISNEADNVEFLQGKFNPEEEEEILAMSRMENIYDRISSSIAPAIFGHEDIKKSICCMLFGGARKHLPDGMRLRGDINILMLGDPSVGKSQFLKFAMQAAPIGVYTSGKGSSAAGLTASVIRDGATGEFHLEGGALVLADGGMVCIDEFDKMRDQDRVAIHEAMEQQTISIAKAGITTILNSRCSILAAANPVFSRYDDSKTATENIEFQTTILSRFDLIFIMRDIVNTKRDEMMATHIVNVHKGGHASVHGLGKSSSSAVDDPNLIPMEKLKRYIAYSRHHVSPRLSESAAKLLKNRYVTFRSDMREFAKGGTVGTAIPITVRQLEAIVRISESLAKMELKSHVNENHVNEALRLFKVSTMQAATSEASNRHAVGGAGFDAALKRAETTLEQRLPIGSSASVKKLLTDLLHHNIEEMAVRRALDIGVSRGRYRWKLSRKMVERIN